MIISDEKFLRNKCADISIEEAPGLILTLEKALHQSGVMGKQGIGLAANQIGLNKNIAIVRLGDMAVNLVNPKIIDMHDPFSFEEEACLSVPNKTGTTKRYNEIRISNGLDPKEFIATGLFAVVIQHEIDHLQGNLFMDRIIKKAKPNDPCYCGRINKVTQKPFKYKKCCGNL